MRPIIPSEPTTPSSWEQIMYQNEGNDISREDFAKGYALYALDLSSGGHFNLVKHGNLRLVMHFASPLRETANVIIYAEFNNMLEIDQGSKHHSRLLRLKSTHRPWTARKLALF